MGLNYKKLEEENIRLENIAKEECFSRLPVEIIHFLNNDVLNHILYDVKYSKSDIIASRVLNNWIKEGVIAIDDNDKGRIKRFNKLHCIWLNIVEEARKYGMNLDSLKKAHSDIMTSELPNFSYLKLAVINTILNEPQIMELSHTGNCYILSESNYNKKKKLPPHVASRLIFSLSNLIQKEFPKSNFNLPINIEDSVSNDEKMLLLFLLKTSCYTYMKVYLSDTDIRLIEDSDSIINNEELNQAISNWTFNKIEVYLENGGMTTISANL